MPTTTPSLSPPPRRALLRDFTRLLFLAVVLPALVLTGLNLWQGIAAARAQWATRLSAAADATGRDIDNFIRMHLSALQLLADRRSATGTLEDVAAWRTDLQRVRHYYPDFNSLAVVDANGNLVLIEPASPAVRGSSVADRSYYQEPRRTGRTHVSDAYRGRVINEEPSAALSAPFFDDGRFAGVVGGAILIDALPVLRRESLQHARDFEMLLLDRNDTVIDATDGLPFRSLDVLDEGPLRQLEMAAPATGMRHLRGVLRGANAYGVVRPLAHGWRLLVLVPERTIVADLARNTAVMLGILVLALLGIRVIVGAQLRRLGGYVRDLLGRMQRFALDGSTIPVARGDLPQELAPLADALNQLAARARQAYSEVNDSLHEQSRLREDLQATTRRLLSVQEDERRTLSRELHDDIGQAITAIKFGAMALQDEADPDRSAEILVEIIAITDETVAKLRNLSMLLRPPQLDTLGLATALRWQAETLFRSSGPQLQLSLASLPVRPDPEVELACFRIAQEALTNTLRHSQASQVEVTLAPDNTGDRLRLTVSDDGRGFLPDATHGLGLVTMRERAQQLGGSFRLDTLAGQGTRITAVLPMHAPRASNGGY